MASKDIGFILPEQVASILSSTTLESGQGVSHGKNHAPDMLSYPFKRLRRTVLSKLALLHPPFGRRLATPTPLLKIEYPASRQSKTLFVFLPGIDDLAEDFERRGIIDEMRNQAVDANAMAVDAHYGYYAREEIFERITDDVILSANTAGYEEIWIAGISLGGFGAALYAAHHPERVSGLMLMAPYLGRKELIDEIVRAGGVRKWNPGFIPKGDHERFLWAWIKRRLSGATFGLPICLGYGRSDRFADANQLLASVLPQECVIVLDGGHDWRTWKRIWAIVLNLWKSRH